MSSTIRLRNAQHTGYTEVSNEFIDHVMPRSNGEFVKFYLYLLRMTGKSETGVSLSSAADFLSCTENDVLRAIRYWAGEGLLCLEENDGGISAVTMTDPSAGKNAPASSPDAPETRPEKKNHSPKPVLQDTTISDARRQELQKQDAAHVQQILFMAEQYIGRPISSAEINRILYLYDSLDFSVELIDYLIDYCVSLGKHSVHYIEKVGIEWYNDGVADVASAKQRTEQWSRDYYRILAAFGVTGRSPVSSEIKYMRRWIDEYGFSMDLILEACDRTVQKKGGVSFSYADGILSRWNRSGAHSLADVKKLDAVHDRERAADGGAGKSRKKPARASNRFNNFRQRDYDYNELEKQLLNHQSGQPDRKPEE